MDISVRLEHAVLAVEGEHDVHAMVEISAPEREEPEGREPVRVAIVLDRSGSMAGRKIEVAKSCASWLVGRLSPSDEVAVVTYDDNVRLVSPLDAVDSLQLQRRISRIGPGGQTNLSGGWLKGLEALRRANGSGVRKILLLSDGLANAGITDREALAEALATSARAEGVSTATIGLGADFDEELMTQMADAGGGTAHFAETPDAAPAIFAEQLDGLTSVVAQNVSLEIRPRASVEMLGILNGYPQVAVDGGVQVELGDAFAGERRRVVLALHVPHLAALGPASVADLVLRYVSVGETVAQHELTFPIVVNAVSAEEAARAVPDAEVHEEILILRAARARDEAVRLADAGDHARPQSLLSSMALELRESALPNLCDEADALEQAHGMVSALAYDGSSRKNLHYQSWQARHRRNRDEPGSEPGSEPSS